MEPPGGKQAGTLEHLGFQRQVPSRSLSRGRCPEPGEEDGKEPMALREQGGAQLLRALALGSGSLGFMSGLCFLLPELFLASSLIPKPQCPLLCDNTR